MRRNFTFIDDVVAGVIAALDTPATGMSPHAVYNIGNSRSEDLGDFVAAIERACGRKANVVLAPMQPGDVRSTFADVTASRGNLGYAPSTPIDVGIPHFIDWFRSFYEL